MGTTRKPKVGLALGSGGARGLAHIGVLKALEAHGIKVDMLAGSSMGSLIAAVYANGIEPHMMEKLALNLKRKHWLDLTVPGMGFVAGEKIKQLIRLLTHGKRIEELSKELAVVATDIETGERVVFREGPVDQAVRASISIPGIFVPERVGDRLLVDGGVIDRVPITVIRDMGADLVIAVDVAQFDTPMKVTTIFDVIAQTIDVMEREILRHQILAADLVIRPDVGHYSSIAYTGVEEIIALGERAGLDSVERIKELIADWEAKQ
ncbi:MULTISPECIES: patatin-like phospholipase family protein [Bacillales]|jgi:NTE family protein|uniref:Esterase n=1 Tax=Brevibacillus aydinogluensis TaxID=927786 RepID=A0AA48M9N9_9BACL|nr:MULTISPECIES: patatin-like phospholipase family protein [Bacillales]REK63052.1 MAG: esterase [Brevibacillus sp.]MBR8658306.1 patatin-like phospholipase family protein [Brevibacillus sp. NL20B1]MDT3414660.1 NTE family protein [Brevibacillus aydinogluensis]NNV03978.1 patatin family protein [Brevibacillus sp. MCWH]UFJ61019.1 patatin-like phospholipase family protein [Anoxybacillus sediminis]